MSPNKCRLGRTYIWTFNQFKINTACCEPINLTTVTSSSLLLCFKSCFRLIDLWTYQYLLQLFIRDFNLVSRSWHINYFTINGNVSNLQREIPCLPSAYNLRFPYRIHPVGKSTLYSWTVSCMCSWPLWVLAGLVITPPLPSHNANLADFVITRIVTWALFTV